MTRPDHADADRRHHHEAGIAAREQVDVRAQSLVGRSAEGALDASGVFKADTVLAKHDEKYMPPEVAESLKKTGVWRASR